MGLVEMTQQAMEPIEYNIPLPSSKTVKPGYIIHGLNFHSGYWKVVTHVSEVSFSYRFLDNNSNLCFSPFWGTFETIERENNGEPVTFSRLTSRNTMEVMAATKSYKGNLPLLLKKIEELRNK